MALQLEKKKICMIGSFGVGKTSLVERYVYNRFDNKYLSTLGVKVSQKILPPLESSQTNPSKQVMLLIWDIAGIDKFDSMAENYYRGAAGALAVVDLTRAETIENLDKYYKKFLLLNPNGKLIILGNKHDIISKEDQAIEKLEKKASILSSNFLLSSAKSGKNVEEGFMLLAKNLEI